MAFSGEPLVRSKYKPSIFEMIKYAKSQGIKNVVMNTNACLMTEDNAKQILESGLDKIFIGIDAFSEDVYNQNRCGGKYHETVANVLKLLELREQSKNSKLIIECQFIEMDNNIHQKKDFIKFWTSKGAHVKIRPMLSWGNKSDRNNNMEKLKDRQPCPWALKTMPITNEGQVVNCGCDLCAETNFGNVYEKTIKEIYNTEMKEFRRKHLEYKFDELNNLCKNCGDWQLAEEKHYHPKVSLLEKIGNLFR